MNRALGPIALIIALLRLAQVVALAQAPPAKEAVLSTDAPTAGLSEAELDQLTAPIALYSDPLFGNILTAATYPLEVVQAHRWLQDPAKATLSGDQLTTALQQQSWDLSVKSLVPFPKILQMMDSDLDWTERIGDAFLAQCPNAPGGAMKYVADGHMTRGFALLAYPATFGDSGIMSFIVNQSGIVYHKETGPGHGAREPTNHRV